MKNIYISLLCFLFSVLSLHAQSKLFVCKSGDSLSALYKIKVSPSQTHGYKVAIFLDAIKVKEVDELVLSELDSKTFDAFIKSYFYSDTGSLFKKIANPIFTPSINDLYSFVYQQMLSAPLQYTIDSLKAQLSDPAGVIELLPSFSKGGNTYHSKNVSLEIDDDLLRFSYTFKDNSGSEYCITNYNKFLIPLKRSDFWRQYSYSINISTGRVTNIRNQQTKKSINSDNKIEVRLSDFLRYEPDTVSKLKSYQVEYFNQTLLPGSNSNVRLYQNNIYDYINLTGFIQFYDLLNTGANNNNTNAQVELNIKAPLLLYSSYKGFSILNKLHFSTNISPLGKYTPYYSPTSDVNKTNGDSIDNNYIRNIKNDIFRNHFINTSLRFTVTDKNWGNFVFISFGAGFRYYNTKIREHNSYSKNPSFTDSSIQSYTFADFSKADITHLFGPEYGCFLRHKVSKVFGYDLGLTLQHLWLQHARNDLLEKYNVYYTQKLQLESIEKKENRLLNLICFESNFHLRPFLKNYNNRSGFSVRIRLYDDLDSKLPPVLQFMLGYSLNLEDVIKF